MTKDMMKIYTSYFANVRNLKSPCTLISIANTIPKGISCTTYEPLVPQWSFVDDYRKGIINEMIYSIRYKALRLSKLNQETVINEIFEIGSFPILLCWEKPSRFCHRHIVSDWLKDYIDIEEI